MMTLSEAVDFMDDATGYVPGFCQEAIILTFGGRQFCAMLAAQSADCRNAITAAHTARILPAPAMSTASQWQQNPSGEWDYWVDCLLGCNSQHDLDSVLAQLPFYSSYITETPFDMILKDMECGLERRRGSNRITASRAAQLPRIGNHNFVSYGSLNQIRSKRVWIASGVRARHVFGMLGILH